MLSTDDRLIPEAVPAPQALLDVVHEDDDLLVVNKPAGLVVHPSKQGELSSVIGRVRLYLGHGEGRLVNRLDRETSGLVLVAKHATGARELGALFAGSNVEKRYVAVVHGWIGARRQRIVAPLGRDEGSAVAIKDRVRGDGANAETLVCLRKRVEVGGRRLSVVEVVPQTGRKHQIRIHLAFIGHSIVGDKIYGDDEHRYLRLVSGTLTDEDRQALMLEHHALHATMIGFGWRGRNWVFNAPPDRRFVELIESADAR